MTLLVLAFAAGVLAIVSPCILPIVPIVFAARGRDFGRQTAPMLVGLSAGFAATAAIGSTAAHWLVSLAGVGRGVALAITAVLGAALLLPSLAERLAAPGIAAGRAILARTDRNGSSSASMRPAVHAAVGVATGLLWAPCAGPVLALIIAGTAQLSWARSAGVLFLFALGAATSLAAVLLLADRSRRAFPGIGRAERYLRRATGVLVLATVALVATGFDGDVYRFASVASTAGIERGLIRRLSPARTIATAEPDVMEVSVPRRSSLGRLGTESRPMAGFAGATTWINSAPLTLDSLRGKVVLIDFWTFACYNCLNALPHVKTLYEKYREKGFVVIGVHTPELPQERVLDNVKREVKRLGITYPVVVDNDYAIWNAYHNEYWPAAYYADAQGMLRFNHFGEGAYAEQDDAVAALLEEARTARRGRAPASPRAPDVLVQR